MCIWIGLVIVSTMLALMVSCDDAQRHKLFTYFFDGVPPLTDESDAHAPSGADRGRVSVRYEHPSGKECNNCHVAGQRRKSLEMLSMAQVNLVSPVPGLCYNCHTDYSNTGVVVHGPVAVGQCLFCHDPHQAPNRYLLKRAVPQLCYLCHDRQMIESIADHPSDALSGCLGCHEGHSASTKGLLKQDWKEKIK